MSVDFSRRFSLPQCVRKSRPKAARMAASLLIFICFNSLVSPIDLQELSEAPRIDDGTHSVIPKRFWCLQGQLLDDQLVYGYRGMLESDAMNYQLLSYAFPPHLFVEGQGNEWVVVNFPDRQTALEEMRNHPGYSVEHDCANGILLIGHVE